MKQQYTKDFGVLGCKGVLLGK